ncbi:aminoglycoside phosphotransferase family protein [Nocardioidaceae bacterium]|nr:aminoglycoside phosphotransferase family protein [Nocardioidaceae bacterium]
MRTTRSAQHRDLLLRCVAQHDGLREVLLDLSVDPGAPGALEALEALTTSRRPSVVRWRHRSAAGTGHPDLLVELAVRRAGNRSLRNEVAGRRWAATAGVNTPRVLAHDTAGEWMVGEAATPVEPDPAYVDTVVAQARLIAAAPAPPPGEDSRSWQAPPVARLLNAGLATTHGLPVPLFLRAREAYRSLPHDQPVHGDFYYLNVPVDAAGRPAVVDWEFRGQGPEFSDVLRMWVSLPERSLRDQLLESLLGSASAEQRGRIGVVARWMAVRQLAENLTFVVRTSQVSLDHAREVLPEAVAVAEALGAP